MRTSGAFLFSTVCVQLSETCVHIRVKSTVGKNVMQPGTVTRPAKHVCTTGQPFSKSQIEKYLPISCTGLGI